MVVLPNVNPKDHLRDQLRVFRRGFLGHGHHTGNHYLSVVFSRAKGQKTSRWVNDHTVAAGFCAEREAQWCSGVIHIMCRNLERQRGKFLRREIAEVADDRRLVCLDGTNIDRHRGGDVVVGDVNPQQHMRASLVFVRRIGEGGGRVVDATQVHIQSAEVFGAHLLLVAIPQGEEELVRVARGGGEHHVEMVVLVGSQVGHDGAEHGRVVGTRGGGLGAGCC